jgi:hypothetical protein
MTLAIKISNIYLSILLINSVFCPLILPRFMIYSAPPPPPERPTIDTIAPTPSDFFWDHQIDLLHDDRPAGFPKSHQRGQQQAMFLLPSIDMVFRIGPAQNDPIVSATSPPLGLISLEASPRRGSHTLSEQPWLVPHPFSRLPLNLRFTCVRWR